VFLVLITQYYQIATQGDHQDAEDHIELLEEAPQGAKGKLWTSFNRAEDDYLRLTLLI
jgi:hypothetical protein